MASLLPSFFFSSMWVLCIAQFVLSDASGPLRPLLVSHAVPLRAERARLRLLPEATFRLAGAPGACVGAVGACPAPLLLA